MLVTVQKFGSKVKHKPTKSEALPVERGSCQTPLKLMSQSTHPMAAVSPPPTDQGTVSVMSIAIVISDPKKAKPEISNVSHALVI